MNDLPDDPVYRNSLRESLVALAAWFVCIVLVLTGRVLLRAIVARQSWWGVPVLVLGCGKAGRRLIRILLSQPQRGLKPVGILDDRTWRMRGFKGFKTSIVCPWISNSYGSTSIVIPLPLFAIFLGSIFIYCASPVHRRRKRQKLGLCLKCGYDLRGSQNRCPECGTSLEKS